MSALLPNNVPTLSRHCQPLSEPDSNPRKRLGRKQGRGTQAESWCSLVDVTKVELYVWRQGQSPASRTGRERRLCMCFAGSKNQILQGGVSPEGRGTGGERLRNRGPGQKPCTSTAAPSKCRFEGDSRHLTSDQRGDLSLTPRPRPLPSLHKPCVGTALPRLMMSIEETTSDPERLAKGTRDVSSALVG